MTTAPAVPNTPAKWACWLLAGVVLTYAGLGFWLQMPGLVGDTDVVRMATGMLHAHARGFVLDPTGSPGFSQHFGYYAVLALTLPESVYRDGTALLETLKLFALISGIFAFGCYATLAYRRFGGHGIFPVVLVTLSPMAITLSYSGHAILPAAALFFLGAVVADRRQPGHGPWAIGRDLLTVLFLSGALSMRADAIIAMPWLVALGWEGPAAGRKSRIARRLVVVSVAVLLFSVVQNLMIPHTTGASEAVLFLNMFLGHATLARAGTIMLLSVGIATWLVAGAGLLRGMLTPPLRQKLIVALILIVPTALFWIPVPAPSRHFFYAMVGVAELSMLMIVKRRVWVTALVAFGVVVANVVIAEILYQPIASRYPWHYPSLTARRATGATPLGWFVPERKALMTQFGALREEGKLVSRYRDRDLVVFADEAPSIVMGFVEQGDVGVWSDTMFADVQAQHLVRGRQSVYIIHKASHWPRDVEAEFLENNTLPQAAVYTQPYTLSVHDRARGLRPDRRIDPRALERR